MPSIRLTAAAVEKLLPPTSGRTDVYDAEVPGLVLRISSSGVKSWSFIYRVAGQTKRLTLGNHPGTSLKLARDRARDARAATQRGEDPVADKKAAEVDRRQNGFASCVRDFVEKYAMRTQRTWKATESALTRYAIAEWGDKPAKEIRRRDVVDLLDRVAEHAPYEANHLRAYLSKLFKWLIEREVVEVSPVAGVSRVIKPQARSRILTSGELIALWRSTDQLGGAFGACTRILMLTGVRRDEAALLRWDEVDEPWAKLPASRMKTGRDFKVALSTKAMEIIKTMPPLGEHVFTTNGRTAISGWSYAKRKLDESMSEGLGEAVADWRLHDLRRTMASGLAMLGFRAEVIKRVLGHAANANDVTAVHYNWHNYDAEALQAVEAWAKYVGSLVSGEAAASNVVNIKPAAELLVA
jgi:integrase